MIVSVCAVVEIVNCKKSISVNVLIDNGGMSSVYTVPKLAVVLPKLRNPNGLRFMVFPFY